MRELRANSQYREQEKAKDAEQKNLKRLDDEYRKKENERTILNRSQQSDESKAKRQEHNNIYNRNKF